MPNVLIKKRFNSWLIMLTCGLFYCYQFALRVLPNTLAQEFMDVFHVEAAGFGIIIASYSAAYAGLQIPLGITIDRIQIKYLLPIAPLLCALGALYNGTHKLDNKINKMRYNFKTKQRRLYV